MVFRRIFIGFLLVLSCALSAVAGQEWSAENVPIPYLKDSTQYVSDPDALLPQVAKDSANYYLQKLNVECGVQNVLVIVGRVADQDAFRMAQDLGNKYGIGYKSSRRGLVVVIAVEDHKYFIAPGSGLEGELTDVDCDDIARACIVKYMREDKPGEAVVSVSRAIYNKVKNGRTGIADVDEGTVHSGEDWGVILFVLFVCFGFPLYFLVKYVMERLGLVKPTPKSNRSRSSRRHDDDGFPPFFLGGGGSYGGSGFSGGSFGGGTFSGGGAGGGW